MKNNLTSVWITILLIAASLSYKVENDHRQAAHRLDLKIMTLEITRNPSVIPRMNVLRNRERATAERWEIVYLLISIAAGIAAISLSASGYFYKIMIWSSAMFVLFAMTQIP